MRTCTLLAGLLAAITLPSCGFEEPPPTGQPPTAAPSEDLSGTAPAVPAPSGTLDPCTDFALTVLDGQLNGLPSVSPEQSDKANVVVTAFVERYDAVIVADGVAAARERYTSEVAAACAG